MLRVDTSSFGNAQWSQTVLPSQITPRADASMVWVPMGSKGSLIVIGGVPAPSDIYGYLNTTQSNQNNNLGPSLMTTIPVYDVAGQVWYTQQTSGNSPPTTAQACAVVASPRDGSSHQIYLYGGYGKFITTLLPVILLTYSQMALAQTNRTTLFGFCLFLLSNGRKSVPEVLVMLVILTHVQRLIPIKCFPLVDKV